MLRPVAVLCTPLLPYQSDQSQPTTQTTAHGSEAIGRQDRLSGRRNFFFLQVKILRARSRSRSRNRNRRRRRTHANLRPQPSIFNQQKTTTRTSIIKRKKPFSTSLTGDSSRTTAVTCILRLVQMQAFKSSPQQLPAHSSYQPTAVASP